MEGSLETAAVQEHASIALRWRRIGFAALVLASSAALLWLMAAILFIAGPDPLGIAMLLLFALTLPWTTIGFWNAVIGFALMGFARDPAGLVAPHLRSVTGNEEIASRTALLICIRNEGTQRMPIFNSNVGITLMRLQLPVRSPKPLIVPCTCAAPASIPAMALATPKPQSLCV